MNAHTAIFRLIRRVLVRLEGSDYKERFERLSKRYAMDIDHCAGEARAEKSRVFLASRKSDPSNVTEHPTE